tara:strand:- start:1123 stop:1977 length:855 start_codon:yes stop_codon:yes gene_type:complete
MRLRSAPLSNLLGVDIAGVDCRVPADEDLKRDILIALYTHQVLVFRGQELTADELIAFSESFGELEMHVNQQDAGYARPNFHTVTNLDANGNILPPTEPEKVYNGTSSWHTDKSYMPFPSMATFLHGIEVTREGGETLFASLTHAYEALTGEEKKRLSGLNCVHHWAQSMRNSGSRPVTEEEERLAPPVTHPLIRTHPENGRKAIYIGYHASHIEGMDEETGRAELFRLLDFVTQDRFVYAHKWQVGDLVVWDNPSLVHKSAPYNKYEERRHLQRTVVRGGATF